MKILTVGCKLMILSLILAFFSCEENEEEMMDCNQSNLSLEMSEKINPVTGYENGSITVSANQGSTPYSFKIGQNNYKDENTFEGLSAGTYTITVQDANECTATVEVELEESQEVSFSSHIKPIIDTYCAESGCHVEGNSQGLPDFTKLENIQANASTIKQYTSDGTMPYDGDELSETQIQLIADWVDNGAKDN